MAYRDDMTALSARHDALVAEVAQKTRELDESTRLLEQARARARLPVLDQIGVASPCSASWDQMTGDDRSRHCDACQKDVYNLSGMTREEAEALILERNGDLCARYYQRADGTILLADCTIGVQRKRDRRRTAGRAAALVAGGLAAAGAVGLHGRATEPPCAIPRDAVHEMVMGKIQAPEPPPAPPAPRPDERLHVMMGAIAVPSDRDPPPTPEALRKEAERAAMRQKMISDPPSDTVRLEPEHEPVRGQGR